MDPAKKIKEKILDPFPYLVSDSPYKVISVILVFTLFMGHFALQAEMDTDEDTFEPDTETSEWMDDIDRKFGSSGEISQIVFIGDLGDALTRDVLLDMLYTKESILEDEFINRTLEEGDGIPDGMITLADIIIQAERTQKLSRSLEDIYNDLDGLHVSIKNQTEMYERLNESLSNNRILAESSDSDIREGSKDIFRSMSYIISNPESWEILYEYIEFFERILDFTQTDINTHSHAENDRSTGNDLTEEEEIPEEGEYFLELFEASFRILLNDPTPEERRALGRMLTNFLEIGENIAHIQPDFGFVEDIPSVEISLDETIEQAKNMTDEDIKISIKETQSYDSEPLRKSIERSIDILDVSLEEEEEAYDNLNETEVNLEEIEEIYKTEGWVDEMSPYIDNYSDTLDGYFELLDGTIEVITQMSNTMRSAEYLPSLIDDMARITISLTSEGYDGSDLVVRRIRAESGMALVQMNTSFDSETRRDAQEEIMELTQEISENSETKVFAPRVMMQEIDDSATDSMNRLLPIAVIFVVIVLMLVYRSFIETIVSLSSLAIAILWTFGAGVMLGYKFNPLIVAVPILITGLVIDYGIHMVMRYREEKKKTGEPSSSTRIAVMTVGGALTLTTVTTAIGFLSNVFSDLLVIRQFGILAAIGISSSLVLMVGFLPSVLQVVEEWRKNKDKNVESSRGDSDDDKNDDNGFLRSFLSISSLIGEKKPWAMVIATLLITMVAAYGAVNVDTTFSMEDFLPEGEEQSENIDYIDANYNISTTDAYILTEGDVASRDFLYAVDHVKFNSLENQYVLPEEGIVSPLSIIQDYGTATVGQDHYNETLVETFRKSDTNDNQIPDENITLLFDKFYEAPESRDSIRSVLYRDEDGEYTASVLRFPEDEQKIQEDLDNAALMKERLEQDSEPLRNIGFTTKVTSGNIISQETTEELTSTQLSSLILTILLVAAILSSIFYTSKKTKILGVLTAFPVTLVTIWIIGTMFIMDVPLNVLTVTITALTVGMGVDYSIHVTHRFLEEMEQGKELLTAMEETIYNTGSALFGSAFTTVGAFAILATSSIVPLSQFGYITAMAITYSFIVAVFLLPSALMLWAKYTGVQERLVREHDEKKRDQKELPVLTKRNNG